MSTKLAEGLRTARYYCPVVTALDETGRLDMDANLRIWDHVIAGGVDGIVLLGSIGEFYALTPGQKSEMIRRAMAHAKPRTRVFVGTGCMTADETIALSNEALAAGADAVMVISPYYIALPEESIEAYYSTVAKGVQGPLYLYNYPDRTGYDLSPQVTLNLLRRHGNIVGYKDTVSLIGHTRALLTAVLPEFPEFEVLSGFDEHFAHNLFSGGCGCIGGLSNVEPALFAAWVRAANRADLPEMVRLQRVVDGLMDLYNVSVPFMPAIKEAMRQRGVPLTPACAHPVMPASAAQRAQVAALLARVDTAMQGACGRT